MKLQLITIQYGRWSTHKPQGVFESATESNEQAPIKPIKRYEGTVDRLDLDNLPEVDDLFIKLMI